MDYPEINMAKRLCYKRKLQPPIDIFKLTEEYASVEIEYMPFEIDGISLNLKVRGKKPHIILNGESNIHRMRFTLSHELGHILIPWHIGNIIDITRESRSRNEYWLIESEANRFASELLIPSEWVISITKHYKYPEEMTRNIVRIANVSSYAATISLIKVLGPGYIFVLVNEDNEVISSGRSHGTLANEPEWHTKIEPIGLFPFCKKRYQFEINGNLFFWWKFDDDVNPIATRDKKGWRDILGQIIEEIGIPEDEKERYKKHINSVIAFANGQVRGESRNKKALYSAFLQRLYSKVDLRLFINHPDFDKFISKKVEDLITR